MLGNTTWFDYEGKALPILKAIREDKLTVMGDINGDGEIGMPDVMYIINYILNGKFPDKE